MKIASNFLLLLFILPIALVSQDISIPRDTIVVYSKTVKIIEKNSTDTIIEVTTSANPILDELDSKIKTEPSCASSRSYILDAENDQISFFWQKKRKRLSPHWSGIGMGFMSYSSGGVPNGDLAGSRSHNFSFNFISWKKQIAHSNWMLVSGLGLDWSRYHFDDNAALTEIDGVTQFVPALDGVNYKDSKLLTYYVTFPLLLEYQMSNLHISGGAVAYFKYYSKSQVKYKDETGTHKPSMGRDLNIRPVDLRLRGQIGIDCVSLYVLYAPWSMFKSDKGPELRTCTFGVMLTF